MPKTILITGANRGIGLELAKLAIAQSWSVIATARKPGDAVELKKTGARVLAMDVEDDKSIEAVGTLLAAESIDVLINNAGVGSTSKRLADLKSDEMMKVMRINAVGPMLLCKALIAPLRRGKNKFIMQITSQLASIANNTGGSSYAYRASKAALNQFNRSLAAELKDEGFTCIAAHPGWVQTDMGGPNAPMTPPQSAEHLMKLVNEVKASQNGAFLNFDGAPMPW